MSGRIREKELRAAIQSICPAAQVHILSAVDSTNRFAGELAKQGAPDGTVVLADEQTAGRGRRGRSFFSPKGVGLYLSVVLRIRAKPEQLLHLTPLAALAVCDAVNSVCGFLPGIKWINDLVFDNRKLGGILTELALGPDRNSQYVILGIGLNCGKTDFPPELRQTAISLFDAVGSEIDRTKLAEAMIASLMQMKNEIFVNISEKMQRFAENCVTIGKEVRLVRGECVREAFAEGISHDGGLIVRFPDGNRETVSSGEVTVRGLYGYTE